MTNYIPYGVTLTKGQIQKIKSAHDNDREVTIRILKKNFSGSTKLPLTQTQINKIKKATSGVEICLSKAQLKHMKKNGGFLPLLALLPAVLGALGGVGGLAGGIARAVNSTREASEQARHNKAIEDMTKQQLGSGMLSDAPIPIAGKVLSNELKKLGLGDCCVKNLEGAAWGTGIYLQREGSGYFLKRQGE